MTSSLTSPTNQAAALVLMAAMGSACGQTTETPDPKPTQSTQANTSAPAPSIISTAKLANPQPARQRYRWQTIASGLDHPWGACLCR